jgi:hypothetical protein
MSRTTVHRLLSLAEPPRWERASGPSKLYGFGEQIAAMLGEDPTVKRQ